MQPIISCNQLTVSYGKEVVLDSVDLEISKGEFLPFIGHNGAGKTTLIRTIIGLQQQTSGEVITPFDEKPPGYVPQNASIDLLFPVSTRDIVQMGFYPELGPFKKPTTEMQSKTDQMLERFKLLEHAHKPFAELSGGMRQKTLIARALVSDPDVLILDEPTTGLDHESEIDLLQDLANLSWRDGKTVLFAQHALEMVSQHATKVCKVHRKKAQIGKLEKYLDNYLEKNSEMLK